MLILWTNRPPSHLYNNISKATAIADFKKRLVLSEIRCNSSKLQRAWETHHGSFG